MQDLRRCLREAVAAEPANSSLAPRAPARHQRGVRFPHVLSFLRICAVLVAPALVSPGGVAAEGANAPTTPPTNEPKPVIWRWIDPRSVGGGDVQVLGTVLVAQESGDRPVLRFNGTDSGLVVPQIPHAGWKTFTIEMRIRPAKGGPEEQRFLHFEDPAGQRGLIELRMTPAGRWSLDTFLRSSDAARVTLHDPKINHPADQWSWVAMVYDGAQMRSYVDGVKELEGPVVFGPLAAGKTSVGVRQTLKSWFLGEIAEVRFHPRVLKAEELAKER